ncbi:MAG: PQQ-binding-like beta-propeller repeat protein [Ignavibacteriales bacterium]
MKKFFVVLLFISLQIFAQKYQYAWITDLHIGSPNAEAYLDSVVNKINEMKDVEFVIASGDITEKGKDNELENAKTILDKLNKPYHIIPGNHDTKWSESGGLKFKNLWNDDKFIFEYKDDVFIGLNSGIIWKGGGGHITPEDLVWLENELQKVNPRKEIFLFIHHPLNNETDNWFKISNIIRNYNIKAVLYGHGHANKIEFNNGIPCAMSRSTLAKNETPAGFTLVVNSSTELNFFEVTNQNAPQLWGTIDKKTKIEIPQIDSLDFASSKNQVIFKKDFSTTFSAEPLIWDKKIYTASYAGIISALDSTGKIIWQYNSNAHILSKPSVRDGYFVFGTLEGELTTLNAYTGELLQTIGFDERITSQFITYDINIDKELLIPKSTDSKAVVVFGTSSGKMFCYDLETLQEYWSFERPTGMIETEPLLINNKIIFGSWDGKVYCINSETGVLIWDWRANKNFYYSPAVCKPISDGKSVFITTPEKIIYAIDLRLGMTNWSTDKFAAWESIGLTNDKKNLLLKAIDGNFYLISTADGKQTDKYEAGYSIDTMPSTPIEEDGKLFFSTKEGNLFFIQPKKFFQKIFFLGTARMHSIQKFSHNQFLISNMDGRIVLFKQKG